MLLYKVLVLFNLFFIVYLFICNSQKIIIFDEQLQLLAEVHNNR